MVQRTSGFDGQSVEVDAIQTTMLRRLVRVNVDMHIEAETMHALKVAEGPERQILMNVARSMGGAP